MTTVTKMRLSKETLTILKNFSSINSNILINPGSIIKTKSASSNIYAEAKIEEEFDVSVPIWDLNKFLAVVSMFANPDLEFTDKYVDISNGRSYVRYHYSNPKLLSVPTREIKIPDAIIKFDLNEENLNEMLRAASILQVGDIQITAKDGVLSIVVDDSGNSSSNSFSMILDDNYSGPDYSGSFNINHIKFVPGSYKVHLTNTVVAKFEHESGNLFYYIAINKG